MTTIIMLLLFPIGLYTYFFIEKKDQQKYQAVFDDFEVSTNKRNILDSQKLELFEQMLEQNGYEIVEQNKKAVVGEKKVLSMSFMMMGLGLYIVGLFLYLFYYFYFQKPHRVEFRLLQSSSLTNMIDKNNGEKIDV